MKKQIRKKKPGETWVCNGHFNDYLGKESIPADLSVTEMSDSGKVVFQNLHPVGTIPPIRQALGSHGPLDSYGAHYVFGLFGVRICRRPSGKGLMAIVLTGEEQIYYGDLNQKQAGERDYQLPGNEWSGGGRNTEIRALNLKPSKKTPGVIDCVFKKCPKELKSAYKDECIVGVSISGEACFEILVRTDGDYVHGRVIVFTYNKKTFGLLEIYKKDNNSGHKHSLDSKVALLKM